MTKRFNAFTLAEVLITLGIIGVVAAMTMPTLMNQTNGAQYKAAYKKALSAIGQAVTLNVALDGGNFADITAGTGEGASTGTAGEGIEDGKTTISGILNSRMNVVKTAAISDLHTIDTTSKTAGKLMTDADTVLYFNDGSVFAFKNAETAPCTLNTDGGLTAHVCEGYIDVNGAKGPNKVVTCNVGTGAVATAKDVYSGTTKTEAEACEVGNPTDVYPVYFYDQTIVPATNAAKAVLYGK